MSGAPKHRGWIKICGITRAADARLAVELGADALGFIFAPESPRRVTPEFAAAVVAELPPEVRAVGVFTQTAGPEIRKIARAARLDTLQLHSDGVSADDTALHGFHLIKVFQLPRAGTDPIDPAGLAAQARPWWDRAELFLLDTRRENRIGIGLTFDWERARSLHLGQPWLAGGGLRPDNVALAIRTLRPYGVDVASGVEGGTVGEKDADKLREFIANARAAFARPKMRRAPPKPRPPKPAPIGYVKRLVRRPNGKPMPIPAPTSRRRNSPPVGRAPQRRRRPEDIAAGFAAANPAAEPEP